MNQQNEQKALLGAAVRGARANLNARESELSQQAHGERQALTAMSKQAVSVFPPQLRAATSDPWLNKAAMVEKGIEQTVKKAESKMERDEKHFEKQIGHKIMNPNHPQVLPPNQLQPRVQKTETHLEQQLAKDEQEAQRAIQKEFIRGRQIVEKERVHMQKDVLEIEKHLRENMNHHQPFKAPLAANQLTKHQCFLPEVMHDIQLKVACCLHHRVHCPQVPLPLLKHHCLTPQATWSATQHRLCCMRFSVGCGTSSSLQHSAVTQQLHLQHPAVSVGASQLPQRGHSTTAKVATTTTTTSMAEDNAVFVHDHASDLSASLPSTASSLGVALAATALLVVALAACLFLRAKGKALEPEDDEEEVSREASREALLNGELRQMLSDAEQADPELFAGRSSRGKSAPPLEPDPAQRAEAEQEMERVLSAKDASGLFGHGDAQQQNKAFRRLVRLLHPDKHLVSGPRANLALRLVLESHRSLTANQ